LYFAEQLDQHNEKSKVHPIAAKALKMLDWIETITRDNQDENKVPT
jgi:hypothetical protein